MTLTLLVVAKAPVVGQVKTRLAADLRANSEAGTDGGAVEARLDWAAELAAELAAASLLDTITACSQAVGADHCQLSLAGGLAQAVRADDLTHALRGWRIVVQSEGSFGQRLAAAHAAVEGPRLQIGMDTPQVSPELLLSTAARLADHDAVLAPASDGGWWALGLNDGAPAGQLAQVAMSLPTTGEATRSALCAAGLRVGSAEELVDIDHCAEAQLVSSQLAGGSQFAACWQQVMGGVR